MDIPKNASCPCGSGKKFKHCHGSKHPPAQSAGPGPRQDPPTVENPFKRIFNADGSVNQEYVLSRIQHLDQLVRDNREFFPLRYDRDLLEESLARNQDIFEGADDPDSFEAAFRRFSEIALPELVTKEFDERAKETLRVALHDEKLSRRDRAAAACGLVLTLPAEGEAPQPPHMNPLFDVVLRTTFNESMARVEFMRKLAEQDLSDTEREASLQEFFRSTPALLFEMQEEFQARLQKAVASYERGEYSFGIGIDMILHGLRAVRSLTMEFEHDAGEAATDLEKKEFADRFGEAIREAFAEDIGEDEEEEIFTRMIGFLEDARASKEKKAARGLSSALEVMERNPEVRNRLLLAAYHEAVTGSRIYRLDGEEVPARAIFEDPSDLAQYVAYGELLMSEGEGFRAERVFRVAMEFFPEDQGVRDRLAEIAESLEPERAARIQERIGEIERLEEEEEEEPEAEG